MAANALTPGHLVSRLRAMTARIVDLRPGLQMRLTALVAALALSVGAVTGGLAYYLTSAVIERMQRRHCVELAQQIASRAAIAYQASGYPAALTDVASEIIHTTPFVSVTFLDAQARGITRAVSSSSGGSTVTEGLTPNTTIGVPRLAVGADGSGGLLDVTYPISAINPAADAAQRPGMLLGYVRLAMPVGAVRAEWAAVFDLLVGVTTLLLAMTFVVSFLLVRLIAAPLRSLAGAMSRFADGDWSVRCALKRGDEIGRLAEAYNVMADRLAAQHAETVRLNADLETRVQRRTQQLRELAARDSLTGLYNRRHFDEMLRRRFAESARYGGQLACVIADVDDFKRVNDCLGHQTGDEVLVLVAETIRQELRSADLAARIGGDEFVVLLPQTDAHNACILANRIRRAFFRVARGRFGEQPVTLSVGVGCSNDPAVTDHRDLVRVADKGLYSAKNRGKNAVAHCVTG